MRRKFTRAMRFWRQATGLSDPLQKSISATASTLPPKCPTHPSVNSPANWLGSVLLVFCAILTGVGNQAMAYSQVRLQSFSDDKIITEGYVLSAERWVAETQAFRQNPIARHFTHYEQNSGIWIADIGTLLYDDRDGDGYFAGFSLSLDVDVDYGNADVYVTLYLTLENTPQQFFHTSEIFTIYGNSVSDEYRIDAELLANFPVGQYDIQIDIHDAWTDRVVDTATSHSFRNLDGLPLESELAGAVAENVLITEYVGSAGPALLLMIGMACYRRRWHPVRNTV